MFLTLNAELRWALDEPFDARRWYDDDSKQRWSNALRIWREAHDTFYTRLDSMNIRVVRVARWTLVALNRAIASIARWQKGRGRGEGCTKVIILGSFARRTRVTVVTFVTRKYFTAPSKLSTNSVSFDYPLKSVLRVYLLHLRAGFVCRMEISMEKCHRNCRLNLHLE